MALYAVGHFCSSATALTREGSGIVWLAFMMGGFAVLWVFWGILSLPAPIEICALGGALVISGVVGFVAVRRARNIPYDPDSQAPNWKVYWGWVVFEIVAAGVGISLLNQFGQSRFTLPWLALVVGIHMFGMGAAFHTSLGHWIGAAMCLVALISLIWLPPANPASADQVNMCDLVVGIGCAILLWALTILSSLRVGRL